MNTPDDYNPADDYVNLGGPDEAEEGPAESPFYEYPEHDKLEAFMYENSAIQNFLIWLGNAKGIILAQSLTDAIVPISDDVDDLIAEHFGCDVEKIRAEREVMRDEAEEDFENPFF